MMITLIINLELAEKLLRGCRVNTLILIVQRRRTGTRKTTLQLFKWQMVTIKWWPISSYKQQTARAKRQSSRCPGPEREGLVEPQRGGDSSKGSKSHRVVRGRPSSRPECQEMEEEWVEGLEGLQTVTGSCGRLAAPPSLWPQPHNSHITFDTCTFSWWFLVDTNSASQTSHGSC